MPCRADESALYHYLRVTLHPVMRSLSDKSDEDVCTFVKSQPSLRRGLRTIRPHESERKLLETFPFIALFRTGASVSCGAQQDNSPDVIRRRRRPNVSTIVVVRRAGVNPSVNESERKKTNRPSVPTSVPSGSRTVVRVRLVLLRSALCPNIDETIRNPNGRRSPHLRTVARQLRLDCCHESERKRGRGLSARKSVSCRAGYDGTTYAVSISLDPSMLAPAERSEFRPPAPYWYSPRERTASP